MTELRTLRARAYGPDADLHTDPAATDRLRYLEEIARGNAAAAPLTTDTAPGPESSAVMRAAVERTEPGSAHPDDHDHAREPHAPEADSDGSGPTTPRAPVLWSAKRLALVMIAALVGAVVVTATITGLVSQRVQADTRQVAVLSADAFAVLPEVFQRWQCGGEECEPDDEGRTVFEPFYGMTSFVIPGRFGGMEEGSGSCLVVVDSTKLGSRDGSSFSGRTFLGCSAGEFPATVQLPVSEELPPELLDRFGDGTALQFILRDSEVVVLSDADAL